MLKMLALYSLGWLIAILVISGLSADAQVVKTCCNLGKEAEARNRNTACNPKHSGQRDPICTAVWQSCCLKAKRQKRCDVGTSKARQNIACKDLRDSQGSNEQEFCCSCCHAGFALGIANRDCNLDSANDVCNDEARSCCVDVKRDARLRELVSGAKKKTCQDRPCSHICITTTTTGYRCICRNGYKLLPDGTSCQDLNECDIDPHRCGPRGQCVNLFGGFYCNCQKGYQHSARSGKCEDIDECKTSRPCTHECRNTVGSFECACPFGYKLESDGRRCTRVDSQASCKNNPCKYRCQALSSTRYQCLCPNGYKLASDYISCRDVDECSTRRRLCADGTTCFNTYGSYKCVPTECPKTYFRRVGQRYCIKSKCKVGDAACSSDETFSYQWLPSAQISGLEPRSVEFYYSLSRPSFPADVRFEIKRGNEDKAFYLEPSGNYKVFLRNRKKLQGPKDYAIELHINIYTNGRLYSRLVNTFYIYVSAHDFR